MLGIRCGEEKPGIVYGERAARSGLGREVPDHRTGDKNFKAKLHIIAD